MKANAHIPSPASIPARAAAVLRWFAEEPFRPFFFAGALWSVAGVALWPLFYAGSLGYHPGIAHARIMIEGFGGAFAVGFLGTAGPRMITAPKLAPVEFLWLFGLHLAASLCHLFAATVWGDRLFVLLLLSLFASLVGRAVRSREDRPPPQMLLALTGVACGTAGALLLSWPGMAGYAAGHRFASLLLYQGFLLAPVMGVGSFLFPRILGGEFGDPHSAVEAGRKRIRTVVAALLLVGSFFLEAWGDRAAGWLLRAFVVGAYLLVEVRWRRGRDGSPGGSVATGMKWALGTGGAGLLLAGLLPGRGAAVEHLLYAGGFGLLMLMVASRVLFGHSGELGGFSRRSGFVRLLVFLGLLAVATRVSTGFFPRLTVSHHIYAASVWTILIALWLFWHRRRFVKRERESEN